MPWYYAQNNQRFGPYADLEFSNMVTQGIVTPETLVWRDGMQDWTAYGQVQPQPVAGVAPVPAPAAGVLPGEPGVPMVVCSSCHRAYPEDEVIQYQGAYVCAACKPIFVQRLREGAAMTGEMSYGGFWIRFAAVFLDGIILYITSMVLMMIAGIGAMSPFLGGSAQEPPRFGYILIVNGLNIAITMSYYTFFWGRFGATPGKLACGLRVVTAEGRPITYLRAFARYWATRLGWLTFGIGFIIAAFDEQKRALHDHICSTRVIRK